MVSCQDTSSLKGSKHSLQHHPHDAALVNAHSFMSMGVEARCCPCHSAAHCRHMKRQPSLCHCCPCRGRHHCNPHHHLCHCRRCHSVAVPVAVAVAHCRRRPCWSLPLQLPSTISAAVSVALPSAFAIAVALAIGHCHLHHRQPLQLPSPSAITVAVTIGHF
jgi:hypothetical protein